MATESSACNCMGPQNGEPFCPCMMNRLGIFKRDGKWIEPEKIVGIVAEKPSMPFSQKWDSPCSDFRHNPPMGLYVAPGETYVHECPACGAVRTIVGTNITCSAPDKFINVPSFNEVPDKNITAPEFDTTTESFAPYVFSEDEDEDAFAAESDDEILNKLGR